MAAAVAADPDVGGAGRPVLAVTATTREAEDLAVALADLIPAEQVAVYPAWETLPHERLSPRSDTVGRRLAVLRRLAHPDEAGARCGSSSRRCGRCCSRSSRASATSSRSSCAPGDSADLDDVVRRLADIAYARVDLVTKRGEFAVRGGILDVFPPTEEHPLRVEFWGDEVEEIRTFAVADQRTIDQGRPALGAAVPGAAAHRRRAGAGRARWPSEHPELAEMLDKLAEGIPVEGMESLAPGAARRPRLAGAAPGLHAGRHASCCCATRSGSAPGPTTWCAPARSSCRRAGPRPPSGGKAPIDLGAAAFKIAGRGAGGAPRRWASRGGR